MYPQILSSLDHTKMELEYCVNVSNKYSLFLQDEDEDPLELIEKTLKLSDKDGDKGKKKDRKGAPLKSSSHNAAAVGVGAVGGKVSAASARKTPSEAVETKEFKREDKENKISKSSDASRNTTVRRPFRAPEKEGLENRRPPPRDRFRPERGNLPPRLSGTPRNDDVTSPPIEDRMVGRFGDTNRGFSRGRGRGRGERGFSFGRGRGVGDRFASSGDQFWAGGGGMNSYSENDSEDKSFIPTYNTFGINSEDSPDVQEGGGMNLSSRSLRGDFTSRGNRGGRSRGGRGRGIPYKGRQFDRQSGSDRSGVKPTDKREGGGAYNWGFPGDEFYNTAEVNTIADEGNIDKEDANKIEGQ
ncbi:unnamed protein product [Soboliphyme baturini]|uniref:HABP4_PAI-RBP1 domain-containing protein n=1 Tax=Soboliphyme baturini TaxID=241478 RepID=A0A183ILI7_9BILA|nr:unnamed protein product [Soboliphyme baturini]